MSPTAGIPHDVLVHILQHVPLKERMRTCSLVQQSWREAAATATNSIALTGMSAAAATAIARQLASNRTIWAQHITSISLEQHSDPAYDLEVVLPQLACPKLRQLHLSGFILTLTATTHSSSADSACAGTRAADNRTAASSDVDSGAADSGATCSMGLVWGCPLLQDLSLTSCWLELSQGLTTNPPLIDALSLLTSFTTLTRLALGEEVYVGVHGGDELLEPNLGPLSALTGLQELRLKDANKCQVQGLLRGIQGQQQQLLPSLSKLSIMTHPSHMKYSTSATPGLYELSSLRCLDLRGAEVGSVQQLSALSHLESLTLHSVTSLRDGDNDPDSDSDRDSDSEGYDDYFIAADTYSTVANIGELLQLLPQLPKLTHLDLFGLAGSTAVVPQWTCLGRCTGLQVLRLQNLYMHGDSWPLLFAGVQLSKLLELRLTIYPEVIRSGAEHVLMPPQVVQQMVDACPNLGVVQLGGDGILSSSNLSDNCMPRVLQSPPVPLAPLAQLQHLTSLRMYSRRTQAFSDLWRLRHLRQLLVAGRVTDLALVQLSALTNLTSFRRIRLDTDRDCECWDDSVGHIALSHSQASPVWQQILDHCQREGWCEAVFQHGQGLQAQVAAQQQQLEEKQQQLTWQEQQLEEQQQQLEEKEQQLEEQQQQLADQAAELAALKVYLATQQLPV